MGTQQRPGPDPDRDVDGDTRPNPPSPGRKGLVFYGQVILHPELAGNRLAEDEPGAATDATRSGTDAEADR